MIFNTSSTLSIGTNALGLLCATANYQVAINVRNYLEQKALIQMDAPATDTVALLRDPTQLLSSLDPSNGMKITALFAFHHQYAMKDVEPEGIPSALRLVLSDQAINQAPSTDEIVDRYFRALADVIIEGGRSLQGYIDVRLKKEAIIKIKDLAYRASAFCKEAIVLAEAGQIDAAADFLMSGIMVAAAVERPVYRRHALEDIARAIKTVDLGNRKEEVLRMLVRQVKKMGETLPWTLLGQNFVR